MKLTKITDTLWLDISTVTAIDTDAEPNFVVIYTTTRQHHVPLAHLDKVLQVLGATEPTSDTFTAHGLTWRKHTPGDPMPCDEDATVQYLRRDGEIGKRQAGLLRWSLSEEYAYSDIIGWNYANAL